MKILSHRGFWQKNEEKNSLAAFKKSFELGFGIETDVRDYCEDLVISHDMPNEQSPKLSELFRLIEDFENKSDLELAINVKADGLAKKLKYQFLQYPELNYFFFDMSIPDMRLYIEAGCNIYVRVSEYEKNESFLNDATGVWLDSFHSEWYDIELIQSFLDKNKKVCIVSPELHKRDYSLAWNRLKIFSQNPNFMLCTDFPDKAASFFKS
jgi:glycerophosphoryl diester phosphodiesterase